MKRFELQLGVYIDAENAEEMWSKFRDSGAHDILNQLDVEDGYASEIVSETEVPPAENRLLMDAMAKAVPEGMVADWYDREENTMYVRSSSTGKIFKLTLTNSDGTVLE